MSRLICFIFAIIAYVYPFSAFSFIVTTVYDFPRTVLVDSPSTALFLIQKNKESLVLTIDHSRAGVSIACNGCRDYWSEKCYVKLNMDTSVPKQMSNVFNIRSEKDLDKQFHYHINTTIIPPAGSISALLEYTAKGLEDAVVKMLELNPSLLYEKGKVTDYSGRTFEQITAFQYALWAYDRHMWELLLKYLTPSAAKSQLLDLEQHGTVYGKHYDFQPFINSFGTDQLGKMQGTVPMHVVNEYTRKDRIFYPTPSFREANLPRGDIDNIPVCAAWYPLSSLDLGLGYDYKMVRGEMPEVWPNSPPYPKDRFETWYYKVDKAAMVHLFQIREKEYAMLKDQLDIVTLKDKHHAL